VTKHFPSGRIAMAAKANKSVTVEQIRDAIHKLKKNSLQFDYVNFNKSKRSTEFLRIVGVQKWGKGGEG
jgi:predicted DNA-binding transcriptional regulator YafY